MEERARVSRGVAILVLLFARREAEAFAGTLAQVRLHRAAQRPRAMEFGLSNEFP